MPAGEPGEVAVHRIAPDGTPDPVFFLEYCEQRRGDAREVHRRLVPHRRPRERATTTATSGTRAAPTTCSRRRAIASGRREIENCLVKHPAVANAAVVPSPDETRGNVVKAFIVLAAGHAPSPGARGGHPAARAQLSGALRVSEGDRVHRRAADDDDRQGAAQGAARAREAARAADDVMATCGARS